MSASIAQILVLNTILDKKKPGPVGESANSRVRERKYKMSLEISFVLGSTKILKMMMGMCQKDTGTTLKGLPMARSFAK